MPTLANITNTFFVSLINRLGVRPPPSEGFLLSNVIQPVTLVDSDVALAAVTTSQLLNTPFTQGLVVTPGASALLADTGAQSAGNYLLMIMYSARDATNDPELQLQRRDAANAANIWTQYLFGDYATLQTLHVLSLRVTLQLNERVRIIVTGAGSAGSRYNANIWLDNS